MYDYLLGWHCFLGEAVPCVAHLGWGFVAVAHNLTWWIWKKLRAHVACFIKKWKSSKMTSCSPSNFEGDTLHLNLLKKTHIF